MNKISKSGLNEPFAWEYNVRREGTSLVLSWSTKPYLRRIRVHTTSNYYPYSEDSYGTNDRINVTRGQWCEMRLSNLSWAFMSDADNRNSLDELLPSPEEVFEGTVTWTVKASVD